MNAKHDLEALREVVNAATDLPWEAGETQHFADSGYHVSYTDVEPNVCAGADPADAALIVAAVNALPVLLDRVAELELALGHAQCGVVAAKMLDESWREVTADRDRLRERVGALNDAAEPRFTNSGRMCGFFIPVEKWDKAGFLAAETEGDA